MHRRLTALHLVAAVAVLMASHAALIYLIVRTGSAGWENVWEIHRPTAHTAVVGGQPRLDRCRRNMYRGRVPRPGADLARLTR